MSDSIKIPRDYAYVVLSVGSTWVANYFLIGLVAKARKEYGVKYPNLYADERHGDSELRDKFNSVQRGHQNFLETWPSSCVLMSLNGLVFPRACAVMGGLISVGRIIYGIGYKMYGPKGRMPGAIIAHLGDFPLVFLTFYTGYKLLKGKQ
mmetsp:Transcript_1247/g.1584  ORF Transcript_1247/g.1584 Transcript_1247/m.1584 type:complete len:150 (-) Transcript_1247:75-524(-)|eukprot:jgi/Bigna1/128047/aug1.5_g2755